MVHAREINSYVYPLVILIKYSASDYYSWNQILSWPFLKADVVAQLLMSDIVVQFLKLEIVIEFLKSDNVADIRYLIRYEAPFIEASLAIAYCIEQ